MPAGSPKHREGNGEDGEPFVVDGIRIGHKDPGCRRLEGKRAIVTAASRGIGYASALRLAQEGAQVVICSRSQENVDKALRGLRVGGKVSGFPCNVSKHAELERFVQRALAELGGSVDILVSNVGTNPVAGTALELEARTYDKINDNNVKSHWELVKLVEPSMPAGSSIVLVASDGAFNPRFPIGIYGMSKLALVGLGRALASELGPRRKIRVNTLCPGLVKTKMSEMLWKTEATQGSYEKSAALQRLGDPVDMAGIVAFLASEDSSYMTGESVVANGGMGSRL